MSLISGLIIITIETDELSQRNIATRENSLGTGPGDHNPSDGLVLELSTSPTKQCEKWEVGLCGAATVRVKMVPQNRVD